MKFAVEQIYHLRSSVQTDLHCPQRSLCNCSVAYHTKEYLHKTKLQELIQQNLKVTSNEKFAVMNAVQASPLAIDHSVHQNLSNLGESWQ